MRFTTMLGVDDYFRLREFYTREAISGFIRDAVHTKIDELPSNKPNYPPCQVCGQKNEHGYANIVAQMYGHTTGSDGQPQKVYLNDFRGFPNGVGSICLKCFKEAFQRPTDEINKIFVEVSPRDSETRETLRQGTEQKPLALNTTQSLPIAQLEQQD